MALVLPVLLLLLELVMLSGDVQSGCQVYGHGLGHCGLSATSTSRFYSLLTATFIY